MADNFTLCLVGAMEHLWSYQIILFHEPISLLSPKTLHPIPDSTTDPSSNNSLSPLSDHEIPSGSSLITPPKNECNNEEKLKTSLKERPTRLNLTKTKTRSHSSSPLTQKRSKKLVYSSSMGTLPRSTMVTFKSFLDLELEEVKGFMDLGFTFKKEQISKRLMSVVPGLQRLGGLKNMRNIDQFAVTDAVQAAKDDEEEEKMRGVMRPYLSEAWLIKRPDSPLLNLRIPSVSAAADMKKHLMFWARSVAFEIQQVS